MNSADRPFSEILADFRRDPLSLAERIPGLWLVNKPPGPSSAQAAGRVRLGLGVKKLGHAGTLDPMAGGLLVLMAGNAARLFDQMQEFPKTYRAGFRLGERTDSQDITGTAIAGWRPERAPPVAPSELEEALERFRGDVRQIPPMHSALKRGGRPLYELARRGEEVERKPRRVKVHSLRLRGFDGTEGELELVVSKGFYVRTLVDDLGLALGSGAVMTSLLRTAIGPFRLEEARTLEELAAQSRDRKTGGISQANNPR